MSGKGRTRRDVGGRASRSVRSRRIRNVDLVGRGLAKTVRAAQILERCLGVSPSLSLSKSDAVHMSWGGGADVGRREIRAYRFVRPGHDAVRRTGLFGCSDGDIGLEAAGCESACTIAGSHFTCVHENGGLNTHEMP